MAGWPTWGQNIVRAIIGNANGSIDSGNPLVVSQASGGAAQTVNQGTAGASAWKTDDDATQILLAGGLPAALGASGGLKSESLFVAGTPASYRSAITAADVCAIPGTVTCTLLNGVGTMANGTYTIFIVAGTIYGRTTATQGNTTVATTSPNSGIRAALAQVVNATFYDVYSSVDGAAAKWVGRITETQRASGIIINGVGTTTAGGTAGAVDIYVAGTGLAVNGGQLAVNDAYVVPASPVDCTGKQYVDFDLTFSRTGDSAAPALIVIPFFLNSRTGTYFAGDAITVYFGGAINFYQPNLQRLRVECRGNTGMALVVASIAGTNASLNVDAVLS